MKEASVMLVEMAHRFIGTTEEGGDNRGKTVELFQKAVDGKAQGEAWCMCFVQYLCKSVKEFLELGHNGKKRKKTYQCLITLHPSEHCLTVWNRTDHKYRRFRPEVGTICIWQYFKNGQPTASGHTGLVIEVNADGTFVTIEGNTGPGGEVVREGDGVYKKTRKLKGSDSMRVVGFLVPVEEIKEVKDELPKPGV